MSLDQDITSFEDYSSNITIINSRLSNFWNLLSSPTAADTNKIIIKRDSLWNIEGSEAYNGDYQNFDSVSGITELVLNDTTSRGGVVLNLVGEVAVSGFGDNFLSGFCYTFFVKQDSVGGHKLRWPVGSSVLGSISEDSDSITACYIIKLPNGNIFVKNNAFLPNTDMGIQEFRLVEDYKVCGKGAVEITGNVLLNDIGSNLSVVKVNGSDLNVGFPVAGSLGGSFTINSDGSFVFSLLSDFGDVGESEERVSSVTYTASNQLEELSSSCSVGVKGAWDITTDVNLFHYLSFDDPNNYTLVGTNIDYCEDLSGNSRHLIQENESGRPSIVYADLNGKDVAYFDGGDSLSFATWFNEQPHCIFYVVKPMVTIGACGMTTSGTCLYNNNSGAISFAAQYGKGEQIGTNGLAAYQHRPNVICNLVYRSQSISDYNIVAYKWETRKPTVFLNGIPYEIGLTANQTAKFYVSFGAGVYGNFTGYVAARVITNGIPTQEVFDKIVGYLAHKWGLTSKLQFNHTWKNTNPVNPLFEVFPDFTYSAMDDNVSGNALVNDKGALSITKVENSVDNVGVSVGGNNGGLFVVNSDGSWSFLTNGDFDSLSGTQFVDTSIGYTATNNFEEKTTNITVRVLADYYSELDYDGGGWTLLTDEHIIDGVNNYSYDLVTKEFSLYAATINTSALHFGANVTLKLEKGFTEVRVFHSGGSGYSCAGVTWNNFIYGGNEDLVPNKTHTHYPGWYVLGCDLIKNTILVNGWNTRTLLYPGTRISLGLGGYSSCTRATMKNIILVR